MCTLIGITLATKRLKQNCKKKEITGIKKKAERKRKLFQPNCQHINRNNTLKIKSMKIILLCKSGISVLVLLFSLMSDLQAHANTGVTTQDEKLLIEVLDEISSEHQVHFTYDSDLIRGVLVDYERRQGESIRSLLSRVLAEVDMDYKIFEDRFVILFRNDQRGLESLEKMIGHMETLVKDRKETISSRQISPVQQLTTDKWSAVNRSRLVLNISGRIIDPSGEPLIGVNI